MFHLPSLLPGIIQPKSDLTPGTVFWVHSIIPTERDELKRQVYRKEAAEKDVARLVFIDETSAYVGISSEYGWASSKERITDTRPKGEKERVSLIAAASLDGTMAEQALVIPDTVNKNAFLCFLETTLLPTLAKGSVLVMGPNEVRTQRNNWSVHHGDDVRSLVEDYGCELLHLPTYSPDLVLGKTAPSGPARNPIEHLFAKLKTFIKALRPETTAALVQAFCQAVKTVTPQNIFNSFQHCGYDVGQ